MVTRSELVEVEIRGGLPPVDRVITEERYHKNYLSKNINIVTSRDSWFSFEVKLISGLREV